MAVAHFSDDAYNKKLTGPSAGTLIGNWFEEQGLREALGEGRTVPQRHIPRSGLLQDFTKVPSIPRKGDNTFERVMGPKTSTLPKPSSKTIGDHNTAAALIKHVGPKELALQAARYDVAEDEAQQEDDAVEAERQVRCFDTTHGTTFSKPDLTKTQKATFTVRSCKAEILHGPKPDRSMAFGNTGLEVPTHNHYCNVEQVTHGRMALADPRMKSDVKATMCSGVTAFHRNSEFSKPVGEFLRGRHKDEALVALHESLQATDPLRHQGGSVPRGATFAAVPSLAALKEKIHIRIAETWGPRGYVSLRQSLFDMSDHEGFVNGLQVTSLFRDGLGLAEEEVSAKELQVYLKQLMTVKKDELRVGALMESLRPALPQKDKRRITEAFKSLNPVNGSVKLGDWLQRLEPGELRQSVVAAFGAEDETSAAAMEISEPIFLELLADLSPLMDISQLLG